MKKAIAILLLMFAAQRAPAACRNTSTVRVRFHGCPTGEWGHVKLGTLGEIDETLPKVGNNVFEGAISATIDPKYPIKVLRQLPVCCAEPLPKPKWTENCVLEYAVYCDTRSPAWGIAATSEEPDVHFSFAPQHPDDFDGYACSSSARVDVSTNTVANLGIADVVEVQVIRDGIIVARFPVHLADVESGAYPMTKEVLKKLQDEAAKRTGQTISGQTRDYVKSQPPLPNKVTVVRR